MAKKIDDYSDDEFELDEEYFSRTYRPLSNLPTPPPSSRNSCESESPRSLLEHGELLESELLGPAIHLANLVPASASLVTPSVSLVHDMLVRAHLPLDIIALAVCILDSLDSRFSLNWRLLCPLARLEVPAQPKRHTLPANIAGTNQLSIDCVKPEVIILAALVLAFKFLEDCQEPTRYYCSSWGADLWTCEQINATERCVMESLGYRILPLWDPELISYALADMKRAAKQAASRPAKPAPAQGASDELHKRSKSSGTAVFGLGLPLTPLESPNTENLPCTAASDLVPDEARAVFTEDHSTVSRDHLYLPIDLKERAHITSVDIDSTGLSA